MAKIKIHNLIYTRGQALLHIQMHESKMTYLPPILSTFRAEGIFIPLIIQTFFQKQLVTLNLILDQKDLPLGRVAFQEGLDLTPPEFLKIKKNILLITFYGPHLDEYPGVVSRLGHSLSGEGVEILAVSASLNSCLLVVPELFFLKTQQALERICDIPRA
ncbi:MAG: hypothetical protein ACPL5I_12345 [Thermodesulfobacteriota bacterium]